MTRKSAIWHPEKIKAELRIKFGSIGAFSRQLQRHPSMVGNVIRRPLYSRRVEMLIAEALDVPVWELWPDRWRPDGSPLPRSIEMNRRAKTRTPERSKDLAA